jgi:hypothetical protein
MGSPMDWFKITGIIAAISLGSIATACAQVANDSSSSSTSNVQLLRDSTYEQFLHYQASPDTAITPARVLRWMNSLMGHTNVSAPSSIEFQPVLRVNDNQKQIIAQFAYKF